MRIKSGDEVVVLPVKMTDTTLNIGIMTRSKTTGREALITLSPSEFRRLVADGAEILTQQQN